MHGMSNLKLAKLYINVCNLSNFSQHKQERRRWIARMTEMERDIKFRGKRVRRERNT